MVFAGLLLCMAGVYPTARAAGVCGPSNSHTICVTIPGGALSGDVPVTVTNTTNKGVVIATWIPTGGTATQLIVKAGPSPATGYSFVWPTAKYLDASGTLRFQHGSTNTASVEIAVTLDNGNLTDFQRNPTDWTSYLPAPWTGQSDPTILAVGDGASGEAASEAVGARVAAVDPPLFAYLGDVYETGTFTENRNHYGESSLDGPVGGTGWGAVADVTQPANGNHEAPNPSAWRDYWHGHPLYTKFTFGGVLFLDMNSSAPLTSTSAQYKFVEAAVTDPAAPPCVVAYWHHPAATNNGTVRESQRAIWQLLTRNGVDMLLTAHTHLMAEFRPMNDAFAADAPDSHMVQLIAGSGGHAMTANTGYPVGSSIAWSLGKTPGLVALTLQGAAAGGTATSLGWDFQTTSGSSLRTGSVGCVGNRRPLVSAGPDQQVVAPAAAVLSGSASDDGLPNPPAAVTTTWSQVSGPGVTEFADPSAPATTATFSEAGTYVLRLTADDSELQATDDVTVLVDPSGTVVLDIPIAVSSDDAEESATGTMSVTSADLELVTDTTDQQVGLRFQGVPIPAGAVIQESWIQFESDEVTTAAASLLIQGQDADDPITFSSGSGKISTRVRTSASVPWVPNPWPAIQVHGPDQRTPGLGSIIDEIIARPGWASGNAMVFILTGSGKRTAEAFDGTFAPVLHVKFSL